MYLELIALSAIIGIGATLIMDIYAIIIKRFFNIPSLDYRLLGRWIGHFKNGVFSHKNIMQAEKIPEEQAVGWLAHYLIGISFSFLLLFIRGTAWAYQPTFWPALCIGLLTTIAPWFLMQPAFGFGVAASKTPNPALARFRSLKAHAIYGIGLYLAAWLLHLVIS